MMLCAQKNTTAKMRAGAFAIVGFCLLVVCTSCAVAKSSADAHAVAQPTIPQKLNAEEEYDAWIEVRDQNPLDDDFAASLSAFSYRSAAAVLGEPDDGADAVAEGGDTSMAANANTVYSPISLYFALALATQGASGDTAREMDAVLDAPDSEAVSEQCGNLFRVLASDPDATVDLANSIWMSDEGTFEQHFVDTATQQFYATPFSVKFGTSEADEAIASWINEHTNGMLEPDIQTTDSMLMSIINTVYFKGAWANEFDPAATEEAAFHTEAGDVTAEFMNQRFESPRSYLKTDRFTRASLSFIGGTTMSFVLPAEGQRIADLVADEALLEEAFAAEDTDTAYLTISLPKADFGSSFDLVPSLKRLGMQLPFSDQADFSNLTTSPAYISSVDQESRITWDEQGAEAAAYTDIGISLMSALPEELAEETIVFDRPFLFELRSSQGMPLFIGVCGDPTQE